MKKILSLFLLLIAVMPGISQYYPPNDPNWQYNTAKSDEFSGTTLNPTLWESVGNNWAAAWSNGFIRNPNFATLSNGILSLKADEVTPGDTNTAGIMSPSDNYKYGYYEILAKLPGFYDTNGKPTGNGLGPVFWTFHSVWQSGCGPLEHDEIDILEPIGQEYITPMSNTSGHWKDVDLDLDMDGDSCDAAKFGVANVTTPAPMFDGWHRWGCEFLPDRMIYYYDGVPYGETYNDPNYPDHDMIVVIDLQLNQDPTKVRVHPDMPFPQYMQIDYFRFYELQEDCQLSVTVPDDATYANYTWSVKANINLGGSTGLNINNNQPVTFRANNTITVQSNTTFNNSPHTTTLLISPCGI